MRVVDQHKSARTQPYVLRDVTCTVCGCMCDDIELTVSGNRISAANRACALGQPWFVDHQQDQRPDCQIGGAQAKLEAGIDRAAEILAAAKYPLVFGLANTTCEAQQAAVGIADWIGGNIDTTTSILHGPSGVSFQGVGEVTSSLGEVANRGDLVIFWGTDPETSHPRHFSKYSLDPKGMFVPRGRADRTCVVVDVRPTASAARADVFLQITPGRDFEALWTLRALARGVALDATAVQHDTGVPLDAWQDLVARMKRARFGVMLFGLGLTATRGKHVNTEALLAVVRDMNAHTRFVARPMRGEGNVTGADNVVTWRTGFPFAVNLSCGYPRFNPGEYSAVEMLSRGEVDAALIVADDPLSYFTPPACAHLSAIPYVALDYRDTPTMRGATVALNTATYGIETPGTVYRMDDVPLPLRPALAARHPSDVDVLSRIERRVRALKT